MWRPLDSTEQEEVVVVVEVVDWRPPTATLKRRLLPAALAVPTERDTDTAEEPEEVEEPEEEVNLYSKLQRHYQYLPI